MAVSVAHAGGVDPETSHSTVEMRKAIAEFTMPLFRLTNVTFTKNHAVIEGKRANYTVHLGSGVVHQEAGRYDKCTSCTLTEEGQNIPAICG